MSDKKGINDKILEDIVNMQHRSIAKITEILKGTKPFAMERVDPDELLWTVNNLHPLDVQDLVGEFGEDNVNKMIYSARMLEKRRAK